MTIQLGDLVRGNSQAVEGQQAARVTLRGVDYGVLGSYAKGLQSGTIAAGLSAGSIVYAMRYFNGNLALVRRVKISAANLGTAFAAGAARFDMFVDRGESAIDATGGLSGTVSGNIGKLRTNMGTPQNVAFDISSTGALSGGTETPDTDPLASLIGGVPATAGIGILTGVDLWAPRPGELPLVLANNEGFIIKATVPATGNWGLAVAVEYDEVAAY